MFWFWLCCWFFTLKFFIQCFESIHRENFCCDWCPIPCLVNYPVTLISSTSPYLVGLFHILQPKAMIPSVSGMRLRHADAVCGMRMVWFHIYVYPCVCTLFSCLSERKHTTMMSYSRISQLPPSDVVPFAAWIATWIDSVCRIRSHSQPHDKSHAVSGHMEAPSSVYMLFHFFRITHNACRLSRVYTPYAVRTQPKCANESTQIRAQGRLHSTRRSRRVYADIYAMSVAYHSTEMDLFYMSRLKPAYTQMLRAISQWQFSIHA